MIIMLFTHPCTLKSGFPNEIVQIDLIEPLPITRVGNRYVLVIDHFTKWCAAILIPYPNAWTVAKVIFTY